MRPMIFAKFAAAAAGFVLVASMLAALGVPDPYA